MEKALMGIVDIGIVSPNTNHLKACKEELYIFALRLLFAWTCDDHQIRLRVLSTALQSYAWALWSVELLVLLVTYVLYVITMRSALRHWRQCSVNVGVVLAVYPVSIANTGQALHWVGSCGSSPQSCLARQFCYVTYHPIRPAPLYQESTLLCAMT